jgi:hypothetical protein
LKEYCKFSADVEGQEFNHPDLYELQQVAGRSRVLIGACRNEIKLVNDLCRDLRGPFGLLYVLIVSRRGNESARYQCHVDLDHDELLTFLDEHRAFLEQDGRHNLWVHSFAGDGQIVLDRHNVLFAYGDAGKIVAHLQDGGFREGVVRFPAPHSHHYHSEFDQSEDAILRAWDWTKKDLQSSDTE